MSEKPEIQDFTSYLFHIFVAKALSNSDISSILCTLIAL